MGMNGIQNLLTRNRKFARILNANPLTGTDHEEKERPLTRVLKSDIMTTDNNSLMKNVKSNYKTRFGKAYLGDTFELIKNIPDNSVNLIMTSPPFALRTKKEYGNVDPEKYVDWFMPFADEFFRVLTKDGSFVLDIGGGWNKGIPTRSLYQFELLIKLCKKFHLAEEFIWYNPARLPTPAEWVTIRRIRVKDAIDYIWWLSKTPNPKADNKKVLNPYSESMLNLLKNGYKAKLRPSGHNISKKFSVDNKGSIPANLLSIANTESNTKYLRLCGSHKLKPHPARYPAKLPEFFIKFLTDKKDLVFDPFAGSNVTGEVAEKLGRRWIAFELREDYLKSSKFRFDLSQKKLNTF